MAAAEMAGADVASVYSAICPRIVGCVIVQRLLKRSFCVRTPSTVQTPGGKHKQLARQPSIILTQDLPMTSRYHAVVWIDHHEARIFHFDREGIDRHVIQPDNPTQHIHHKANTIGSGHAAPDHEFLHRVANAVAGAQAVLITGPANTKTELAKHIRDRDPHLGVRIAGIETVDHPSDKALVAHARAYFKDDNQVLPRVR